MKRILFLLILMIPVIGIGQNLPEIDSLIARKMKTGALAVAVIYSGQLVRK